MHDHTSRTPPTFSDLSGANALGRMLYSGSAALRYAYCAAVLDAKGEYATSRRGVTVFVRFVTRAVAEALRDALGGSVTRCGRNTWKWRVSGAALNDALVALLPYTQSNYDLFVSMLTRKRG